MIDMKNEFIFAPIKLGYTEGDGVVTDRHIAFYTARSKHIGAVTLEPLYMEKGLRELPTQLGIDRNDKIEGLKRLNGELHSTGAKVIAHLNHPGRLANPKLPGNYYISATDKPCETRNVVPKKMTEKDMDDVIGLYKDVAVRAEKAGFDIIEMQFGHGYLMAQFISPAVNDRDDEYGGSFDNRIKFPMKALNAVKEATDLPIIARISGDEMIPNGIKLPEAIALSKKLEKNGVEAIHVSAGTLCSTPPWFFQHMFIPKGKTWELAKEIKKEINIPAIFVGKINTREDVDKVAKEYGADYIAMGRALVADPNFLGKYFGEVEGAIRPCLACSDGCVGGVKSGMGIGCVVNPSVGKEAEKVFPAEEKKSVAIAGGGLAGMQAALTLKERGHDVTLYEKDKLGGQFNLAWLPPKKGNLKKLVDYYLEELDRLDVKVKKEEANEDNLLKDGYEEIIIATGAKPATPPIKGLKEYYWADFLKEENLPQKEKILIVGGGLIGIEVASKMTDLNNEVIIVEMLGETARGMEMIEKGMTLKKLKEKNVEIHLNTKVEEIQDDKAIIEKEGEKGVIEGVDKIVMATGMSSVNDLRDKLAGKASIHLIGDAAEPRKAQDAISDGYEIAKKI